MHNTIAFEFFDEVSYDLILLFVFEVTVNFEQAIEISAFFESLYKKRTIDPLEHLFEINAQGACFVDGYFRAEVRLC